MGRIEVEADSEECLYDVALEAEKFSGEVNGGEIEGT